MLLDDKVAVIYGTGGAIGGAVARTFAREGAKVFLSGRNAASVEAVVDDTVAAAVGAEDFRSFIENLTLLKRLPTLADVANTAAFLAFNHAAAISGSVANLTCGMSVD